MEKIIEVSNLTKEYKNFKLNNISFSIAEKSIVGLVGQNGAGKTTLIKSILELVNKNSGEVKIFGSDDISKAKEDMGVILDNTFFPEILRVNDINSILKSMYKKWDEELFKKYLNQFDLDKNNYLIKELSTGMKKKLEIACAFAHKPKLLILDEPTSGLDPIVRSEILDIFDDYVNDNNASMLFSTHITTDLENVADSIIFINDGNIIFSKTIDEIDDNYGIITCDEKEFEQVDKTDYLRAKKNRKGYELLIEDKKALKKKYKKLNIKNATIDDIMLLFVKGDK